jgi:hypothetical protein
MTHRLILMFDQLLIKKGERDEVNLRFWFFCRPGTYHECL